jgi:hypothetical protein
VAPDHTHGCRKRHGLTETASAGVGLDAIDHHHLIGKALATLTGKDNIAIDADLKDPFLALDEFAVDTEFLLDRGRQTGGLREVVSLNAVLNRNVHGCLL